MRLPSGDQAGNRTAPSETGSSRSSRSKTTMGGTPAPGGRPADRAEGEAFGDLAPFSGRDVVEGQAGLVRQGYRATVGRPRPGARIGHDRGLTRGHFQELDAG